MEIHCYNTLEKDGEKKRQQKSSNTEAFIHYPIRRENAYKAIRGWEGVAEMGKILQKGSNNGDWLHFRRTLHHVGVYTMTIDVDVFRPSLSLEVGIESVC